MSDQMPSSYARRVGDRLRSVRQQQRLSLQAVEAASGEEFKASVLGAYERGERAISVPRLQRLARYYNVPVDQLLPRDAGDDRADRPDRGGEILDLRDTDGVSIDLMRLEEPATHLDTWPEASADRGGPPSNGEVPTPGGEVPTPGELVPAGGSVLTYASASADLRLLGRYLATIQVQRQDFNGRVLTIRREDVRALAALFDVPPEAVRRRLDQLGVRR